MKKLLIGLLLCTLTVPTDALISVRGKTNVSNQQCEDGTWSSKCSTQPTEPLPANARVLTWTKPPSREDGTPTVLDGYLLRITHNNLSSEEVISANDETHTLTGLATGLHTISLRAIEGGLDSVFSSELIINI